MSWTDKLKELSGFGTSSESERSEIAALMADLGVATAALGRAAELAPTPTVQSELRPLIVKAESVVQQVRGLLHDYGTLHLSPAPKGLDADGHNHWARLLAALQQHRKVRQELRALAISIEETNPSLSDELVRIGREEEGVVDHLRDLIALADPQALD